MLIKTGRRSLLAGLSTFGGMMLLRPFLRREAAADGGVPGPMRLVVIQTPDGRPPETWVPQGTTTDFTMASGLTPFEPLKDDLVILSGIDIPRGPGENHCQCFVALMTGTNGAPTVDNYTAAQAPSIDQVIGLEPSIVGDTIPTLQIAGDMTTIPNDISHRYMSWAGADQPLPGEHRSTAIYETLFSNYVPPGDDAAVKRLVQRRGSVLDVLEADLKRISDVAPAAQRPQLDAHLEAIRTLEKNLDDLGSSALEACIPPAPDDLPDQSDVPKRYVANLDMVRLALACDLSRVVTFMSSPSTSNLRHRQWIPEMESDLIHHYLSHEGNVSELTHIGKWYAGHIANFVQGLKRIPDGVGTLLDHTVVVYTSELGYGAGHSSRNTPTVIFGSAAGRLSTGRYLNFLDSPRPFNDVWVSVAHLLGLPWETFGSPEKYLGPIPGLAAGD